MKNCIKLKIKTGDKVKIIYGKYKGTEGTIKSICKKKMRVVVTGVDLIKQSRKNKDGKTVVMEKERPIHYSNVSLIK